MLGPGAWAPPLESVSWRSRETLAILADRPGPAVRPELLCYNSPLVKRANKVASTARETVEPVSELTTNRLSVYLRCLTVLETSGVRSVSSQALAEQFNLNAAQIRKDLAHFGE